MDENEADAASGDDTVAQTGPGIPDDAAEPGYDPVADAEREHDARPPDPDEVFGSGPDDASAAHPS